MTINEIPQSKSDVTEWLMQYECVPSTTRNRVLADMLSHFPKMKLQRAEILLQHFLNEEV